ncbi:hypothetical protein Tco_1367917 [Tanacetum coccineum]
MYDKAFKRVDKFEDFRTELVEGKEKRVGTEMIQENAKKQKVEDDKETAKLKYIVGWKIHKEGRKSYYQIIRADGKSQMYMIFSHMLKSFNREDLEDFYKLVKAKYKSTRPVEDLDLLLWGDLKTMFEPHVEDAVWKNQQDYKVLDWKLYDSCGGRIVGIKSLLDVVWITAAHVYVNAAQLKLVLLVNISAADELQRKYAK